MLLRYVFVILSAGLLLPAAGCYSSGSDGPPVPLSLIDDGEGMKKYWFYRQRLVENFLGIADTVSDAGHQNGWSIPANEIFRGDSIKWGDATTYLGWYIAVLATEYELLNSGRLSVYPEYQFRLSSAAALEATGRELHRALLAVQRVDRVGENAFLQLNGDTCTNGTDREGFFIRDDVPSTFAAQLTRPKNMAGSDFIAADPFDKEMSQDQIYHLLMGLAMVKRYANVMVEGTQLGDLAVTISGRLVHWVSKTPENPLNGVWQLENPACGSKLVKRGESAGWFSTGLVRAIEFISPDGTWRALNEPVNENLWLNFPLSAGLSNLTPVLDENVLTDNLHMAMVLSATGNGWGNLTQDALVSMADVHGWYAYPLIHFALHGAGSAWGVNREIIRNKVIPMLAQAPSVALPAPCTGGICEDPVPVLEGSGPSNQSITPGWRSSHRFLSGREEQVGSVDTSDSDELIGLLVRVDYNGLDFMLLHNLYRLAFASR